ncbi:Dabb family protein [Crossiella sp. CA198]|uniref:Dabb family protein n=1 Tax=Crossiella sp. CA198 TaxID=3455607 RepID=UPI003F8D57A4
MIYHGNRFKLKAGVTQEQIEEALELMHTQGREIPVVKSYIVGREFGSGGFDWGAVFALEDLDAYWDYLTHPAHTRTEREGMRLLERFEAYDITDEDDPDFAAKVAALQQRHRETDPVLKELLAELPVNTGVSAVPVTGSGPA